MPTPHPPWRHKVLKICKAKACRRPHRRLGQYCGTHERRKALSGNPEGQQMTFDMVRPHREPAEQLLKDYSRNSAVKAAIRLAQHILDTYGHTGEKAGVGRKVRPVLDSLVDLGVDGEQVLAEMVAIVMYWELNGSQPTGEEMDVAFGGRLLKLRRKTAIRASLHSAPARRHLGFQIRSHLYVFCAQIVRHWEQQHRELARLRAAADSFAVPPVGTPAMGANPKGA